MGWTIYHESKTKDQALAEMRRLHDWRADDGTAYRVLADGITGSGDNMGYYAAVSVESPGQPRTTFAAVCLIILSPFGYKDMSESMGPRICNAPREVLEALEPLPPRNPEPCKTCEGSGQFNGRECFSCDGEGAKDRHDYARRWRKDAWARFGGEPQGQQLALV